MKIVHIAPVAPYNDYWGYQENLLPKYHRALGHDVTLIVTNGTHADGKIVQVEPADYVLNDGVRVIRLKKKEYALPLLTGLRSKLDVLPLLNELRPDLVFYHGLISTTIKDVIKYKKKVNPDCVIVQDNHLDYFNGQSANTLKQKLLRAFYRRLNRQSISHVSRVYGVTPWRKQYAEDYFKIPKSKTDVLIMGADDEKIDLKSKDEIKQRIRAQHGIREDDFLIVTGGKIDKNKGIDALMQACADLPNAKLLIFGNVLDNMKEQFDLMLKSAPNIIYIGWLNADKVYDYFLAADLVCFPGSHSVMWEQACACKVPCLFKHWDGMEHVNNGGNSLLLRDTSSESLRQAINELCHTPKYDAMRQIAASAATDVYLYSHIAKKSLECSHTS